MWIVQGPFDGEVVGDTNFQKRKLLKPNTSYTVGRKDRPLLVNNKKISHDHCDFSVGPHTPEDAGKPDVKPTLEIISHNKKDKTIGIRRQGKDVFAYPASNEALEDDDVVSLISGVTVTVKWVPLCIYSASPKQFSIDDCASLGIKLVHTPRADVTHHISTEYTADLASCASLLSLCQFVKPAWLQEVIRLGKLTRKDHQHPTQSLEDLFALPSESKYQPTFSSPLEPSLKKLSVWQPNEERVNLLRDYRFLCVQEKASSADSELRELLVIGGASLEAFNIHSGTQKFRRALTRSQMKEGKKTVVVGNADAMRTAIGEDAWNQLCSEAESCALTIHSHSDVIHSVLNIDCTSLESKVSSTESSGTKVYSPDAVQAPAFESEAFQPSQSSSRPRLVRRAASRAASRESTAPPQPPPAPMVVDELVEEAPPPPRKQLTRRVRTTKPIITGIDDPSHIIDAVPDLSSTRKTPPPKILDLTAPTPARSSRLKRRLGTTKETTQSILSGIPETVVEPPLKKFKALFEATNTEGTDSESQMEDFTSGHPFTQTQDIETQMHAAVPLRDLGASTLAILKEEEEETQLNSNSTGMSCPRGSKRRLPSEEDVERQVMDGSRSTTVEPGPASKRRAIENRNSVDPVASQITHPQAFVKPSSTAMDKTGTGAAIGQPDKDPAFLTAIASTKKGKKHEDDFDREFNKLKISKPELNQRDPEEEWKVLADFGDDSGLRGNFMVILEMDVYSRDKSSTAGRQYNGEWDGKPNFKKFKKKSVVTRRHLVDLVVSEQTEYGMGTNYWKSGNSQSHSQPLPTDSQNQDLIPSPRKSRGKARPLPDFDDDDNDEEPVPRRSQRASSRKPPSRAGSSTPAPTKKSTKGKAAAKASALFLDSDDDIQEIDEPMDINIVEHRSEETLKSSPEEKKPAKRTTRTTSTKKPTSRAKKQPVVVVDDDSDDDAVFKGFKGKAGC